MDSDIVTVPEHTELVMQVETWPDRAKALTVRDDAAYMTAGNLLLDIKGLRKQIDDTFDPIIKKAYEAHKAAVAAKRGVEAPLEEAENVIKAGMGNYNRVKEARLREEEARLAAERRKQEEEARLAEAVALESAGDAEAAEAVLAQPIIAPVVKIPNEARVAGISHRENWRAEVIDVLALVRFIAQRPEFVNLVMPNMPALNSLAKAQRSALNVPGVRAVSEAVVAARAVR